jgi:hypothetical protein
MVPKTQNPTNATSKSPGTVVKNPIAHDCTTASVHFVSDAIAFSK